MIASIRRRLRPGPSSLLALPVVAAVLFAVVSLGSAGVTDGAALAPEQSDDRVDLVAQGRDLFVTQCSSCHSLDGRGVEGRGPSLEPEGEASTDFVLRTGRMPLAAPNLQAQSGPVRYSEDEILALVAYVGEIGSGPEIPDVDVARADVANGGDLFRLNCAACHVSSGAGAPIGGGRQAPNLTDSGPTVVGEAIKVGPGSMPIFASLSDQEIDDIAGYIEVLGEDDTTGARKFGGAGPVAEGLAAWLLALIPLIAVTRWIGQPKAGRDGLGSDPSNQEHVEGADPA